MLMLEPPEQNEGSICLCWQQGSLSLWLECAKKELTWGGSSWLDYGLSQGPLHLAKCLERGGIMQEGNIRPTCCRSLSSRLFQCTGQKLKLLEL